MVEIIPKEIQKPSKELNVFFYFVVFFLILSVIGHFALNNFLKKGKEELAGLKADLAEIMTPEGISLEKELLFLEDKIDKFSFLFEEYPQLSGIFEVVEANTHPQVWFSEFDLNSDKKELKVSGQTQSFKTLGEQIFILEGETAINKVNLEKFSITKEGRIAFGLFLSFKSDIFKR